jgi:glutathione S-transferase
MTLTVYDGFRSPNCDRVLIALNEKRLPYRRVTLNLSAKEQKRSDFMRLNPYGRVPVLVDGDLVLYESCVINEYLDAQYPTPPLTHGGPAQIAQGKLLIDYALNFLHEWYWPLRAEMRKPENNRDVAIIEQNRPLIATHLHYLEAALGDQPYFFGIFSLTDIGLWPRLSRIADYGALAPRQLPRLAAWLSRMNARPSVKAILDLTE